MKAAVHVSDGHIYGRPSHRMRYACSPAEDWPPPLDLSSDGDVDATVLQELYPDSPPGYEECVGPGATQLYIPTDAPPPYSLTDSCPELDAGNGHSPGRHQQAQRSQGQSGLRTVSMDTLPPYEAVCGISPPSGRLPLPGPHPGPQSSQGSPAPTQALALGPEQIILPVIPLEPVLGERRQRRGWGSLCPLPRLSALPSLESLDPNADSRPKKLLSPPRDYAGNRADACRPSLHEGGSPAPVKSVPAGITSGSPPTHPASLPTRSLNCSTPNQPLPYISIPPIKG